MKSEWLADYFVRLDFPAVAAYGTSLFILFPAVLISAVAATYITRKTLIRFIIHWIQDKQYQWGGPLLNTNFFTRVSWFVPLTILSIAGDSLLLEGTAVFLLTNRLIMSGCHRIGSESQFSDHLHQADRPHHPPHRKFSAAGLFRRPGHYHLCIGRHLYRLHLQRSFSLGDILGIGRSDRGNPAYFQRFHTWVCRLSAAQLFRFDSHR